MTLKKAITTIKLSAANHGKLHALETLAVEHRRVVQAYIDWLIEHKMREPDKYADVADVPTCRPASRPAGNAALGNKPAGLSNPGSATSALIYPC
jgi:hypothetical protein